MDHFIMVRSASHRAGEENAFDERVSSSLETVDDRSSTEIVRTSTSKNLLQGSNGSNMKERLMSWRRSKKVEVQGGGGLPRKRSKEDLVEPNSSSTFLKRQQSFPKLALMLRSSARLRSGPIEANKQTNSERSPSPANQQSMVETPFTLELSGPNGTSSDNPLFLQTTSTTSLDH